MTWVKICGITNLEDALTAVEAGADALGFVFYEKSPRRVDLKSASEIIRQLPVSLEKVGVFVNKPVSEICEQAKQAGLTALQLHKETNDVGWSTLLDTDSTSRTPKLIPAVPGRPFVDGGFFVSSKFLEIVFAVLVDSGDAKTHGGTGRSFDWEGARGLLGGMSSMAKLIVAGGLNSTNVTRMMGVLHPWGVDVASGVEARPGKKDPAKVHDFIAAVREADRNS